MKFVDLTEYVKGKNFNVFDNAELVVAINLENCANYSRKQIDSLIDFVKTPQVGASGLVYCKFNEDGSTKSSVDKFYDEQTKALWKEKANCKNGDMLLIMCGEAEKTRKALGVLRLKIAEDLGLRDPEVLLLFG